MVRSRKAFMFFGDNVTISYNCHTPRALGVKIVKDEDHFLTDSARPLMWANITCTGMSVWNWERNTQHVSVCQWRRWISMPRSLITAWLLQITALAYPCKVCWHTWQWNQKIVILAKFRKAIMDTFNSAITLENPWSRRRRPTMPLLSENMTTKFRLHQVTRTKVPVYSLLITLLSIALKP